MKVGWRLFVLMAMQLAIWGAWAPKLFPHMSSLGFGPWQQSLVGSCWGISAVAGIFFSNQFADRTFSAERFLFVSHVIGGFALLGTAFSQDFWPFFACFLIYSMAYVPTMSVANSVAFAHLANPARQFGFVRTGGTAGWMAVSWPLIFLLGRADTSEETRWIFIVAATVSFACALWSLTLPRTPPRAGGSETDPLAWRKAIRLLRQPFVAVLFAVTFIDSIIHNGYFVIADAFLTNRVGIAGNLSMVVLSLGQLAEVLTMLALGFVLIRLGWRTTMVVGVLGHAMRFTIFALFPDTVPLIIAVQLLHGVCYAFFFATVYIFVDHAFPNDVRASAQGLFNLLILGIGNVIASFLFPALVGKFSDGAGFVDYRTLFMVPIAMALVTAVLLAAFFRPPDRGPERAKGRPENDAPPIAGSAKTE